MATYSRVKTFVANETLTASDLNAEFNNIITNTNSGNLNSDNVSTSSAWTWTGYHTYSTSSRIALSDDIYMTLGNATDGDYRVRYNATSTALEIMSTDSDGAGTDAVVLDIQDGTDDLRLRGGFSTDNNTAPTSGIVTGGNIVSDTDGTDDLGTTSVRWANLYVDAATITNNLTVGGTLTLTGGLTLNGNVTVGDSASDTLTINSTITSNLLFTDATYDIGASGATRPRDLFLSRNAVMGGTLGVTGLITASGGVSGALTGNVTGNVTGDVTGDVTGNLTGNVTGNVTGNLTGDVTGNISGNVTGGTISGTTGTFSGDFAINTSTLKVDTGNNRVGVKNASPSYPLDIGYTAGINQVAWRGSSNEIGFLTFGSSTDAGAVQLSSGGAAKILFDAAGNSYINTGSNFGIGTSSPQAPINAVSAYSSGTTTTSLKLATVGGYDSGSGTSIDFGQDQSNYSTWLTGKIASPRTGTNWGGSLVFYTNDNSAATGIVERLRLNHDGNMGLGVTPSAWLSTIKALQVGDGASVYNSGGAGGDVYYNNNWYVNSSSQNIYLNNGYALSYGQAGGEHRWFTAASGTAGNTVSFTQAMTLTSAGLLGIGTTSPAYTLDVQAVGSSFNPARFSGYGSSIDTFIYADTAYWSFGDAASFGGNLWGGNKTSNELFVKTNGSRAMTIDSSQRVGIGTASPADSASFSRALDVNGPSGAAVYVRTNGSASDYGYIGHYGTTAYFVNASAGPMAFYTNGSERARIDSSGNVLVGGTSQSGTANRAAVFSANKFGLSIIDTTAQAAGVGGALNLGGNYRSAGDAQAFARIEAVKENGTDANYAYGMAFSTTPNGGTFTERVRILSSGGITFNGDTAAANALDDYEEGTWSPTYLGSTTNPSVTYLNQFGHYTKIGNIVWLSGYLLVATNNLTGGSGDLQIGGLPFNVDEDAPGAYQFLSGGYNLVNGTATGNDYRLQANNPTKFDVYGTNSTPTWSSASGYWEHSFIGVVKIA